MRFHRRVAVIAFDPRSGLETIVMRETAEHAKLLVARGQAIVHHKEKKTVMSIRRTHIPTAVQAGSFGILREHCPVGRDYGLSGGVVFSHKEDLHDGNDDLKRAA